MLVKVDIGWLLRQYATSTRFKPMHVVVGEKMGTPPATLRQMIQLLGCNDSVTVSSDAFANDINHLALFLCMNDHVQVSAARLPLAYGTHHTKMTMLYYDEEKLMRIVIGTANLVEDDWAMKTQGVCPLWHAHVLLSFAAVYISPLLQVASVKRDSVSSVQSYLINYLSRYEDGVVPSKWSERIRAAHFEEMDHVRLITWFHCHYFVIYF